MGLRQALPTERGSLVACWRNAAPPGHHPEPEIITVQAIPLPSRIDPLYVTLMRGFASVLWQSRPTLSATAVGVGVLAYSEQIGATDAELDRALIDLQAVRNERPQSP